MEMQEGQRVQVRLHSFGDEWFSGVVLDRPRKQWVQLDNPPSVSLNIADENTITEWRPEEEAAK